MTKPLWQPSQEEIERSNMMRFIKKINTEQNIQFKQYDDLYQWSIQQPEKFWPAVWEFCNVKSSQHWEQVLISPNKMPGAKWFSGAQLNFAENLLSRRDDKLALVFQGENGERRIFTYQQLYTEVAQLAAALRQTGVTVNDRVAGWMPNCPETIIAMLATTSIGAVWSSCSPDFGQQGVLDRFGQIAPKILFATDGQYYNGKTHDLLPKVNEVAAQLTSLKKVIVVPFIKSTTSINTIPNAVFYENFLDKQSQEIQFAPLPFDHPVYIMYSSGTTGIPKCIVHGAGGTLLQHLKELVLHTDLKPEDNIFYYTTCGWMMWNWFISSLAVGATLILYDGSPFYPKPVLFDLIDAEKISVFGTSAKFISAVEKFGLTPKTTHKLDSLRTILSTGSPLLPESFDFVYEKIKTDLCLASISGGTDIISCFALGNPIGPVYRSELQCRGLGMKVEVFNDAGQSVRQEKGELVCTAPFPSMPIYFWNDADGSKYQKAYFEKFPGIWAHGDFAEITEHNGVIIYGRSDAVLNPGGVRIGTAEIYRQVEKCDEVLESIAIGQEWQDDTRVVLFVRLREDLILNEDLIARIKALIRSNASPHHVPAKILQVADIPRTISGKMVELAVRNIIHGLPVKNIDALANPEALEYFKNREELKN